MPIYEYKCTKCGKIFEEHQSHKDKPVEKCMFCQSPVKRVFSPVGISFKGSGFHVNDYSNKSSHQTSGTKSQTSSKKNDTSVSKSSIDQKKSEPSVDTSQNKK